VTNFGGAGEINGIEPVRKVGSKLLIGQGGLPGDGKCLFSQLVQQMFLRNTLSQHCFIWRRFGFEALVGSPGICTHSHSASYVLYHVMKPSEG